MFLYKRVYTVASLDTQCIVSNFESERYISRVGRDGPLHTSLPRYVRYLCGTYGTEARHFGKELTDYNTKKHTTLLRHGTGDNLERCDSFRLTQEVLLHSRK